MPDDDIVSMLLKRLNDHEDNFVERKSAGVSYQDICKTLVAFTNALDRGQQAILFIGVANDGRIIGVENPDERQKWVAKLARKTCYPPVPCKSTVFEVSGKNIVAVIVEASE